MIESGDTLAARLPPVAGHVDSEMAEMSQDFDWLEAVTPCGTEGLWREFEAGNFRETPEFRYRDPDIDVARTRQRLLGLPIREIEDSVFKALLGEKQRELDRQLELVELRGTGGFLQVSTDLFGDASSALHADALQILETVPLRPRPASRYIGPEEIMEAALHQFEHYRGLCRDFHAEVRRSPNITAGMLVTNSTLYVSESASIPHERLDALLHHEIGTHILTWHNGGHQPLRQLQTGLAHYDELQEGLGVLAEYLAGNLSPLRLRTLAARVVAVRLVTDGAAFPEVFELLRSRHRFSARAAFTIATRVFRGGGLTKDVVYLRGLKRLLAYLREGHAFEKLLIGKFSLSQVPALRKLEEAGWVDPPRLMPSYAHNAASQERLAQCTEVPLDGLYQRLVA